MDHASRRALNHASPLADLADGRAISSCAASRGRFCSGPCSWRRGWIALLTQGPQGLAHLCQTCKRSHEVHWHDHSATMHATDDQAPPPTVRHATRDINTSQTLNLTPTESLGCCVPDHLASTLEPHTHKCKQQAARHLVERQARGAAHVLQDALRTRLPECCVRGLG